MLGKIAGRRKREQQSMKCWMASPTQGTWVWANSGDGEGQGNLVAAVHGAANSWTWLSDLTTEILQGLKGKPEYFPLYNFPNVLTQSTRHLLGLCNSLPLYSNLFHSRLIVHYKSLENQSVSEQHFEPHSLNQVPFLRLLLCYLYPEMTRGLGMLLTSHREYLGYYYKSANYHWSHWCHSSLTSKGIFPPKEW